MAKRQANAKQEDVNLVLEKDGVKASPENHPSTPAKVKDKIKNQNEKAAKDVASSQSYNNFIPIELTDYNGTGEEINVEGVYVKKESDTGKIEKSTFDELIKEKNTKEKQALKFDNTPIVEKESINQTSLTDLSNAKNSQYGPYVNATVAKGDINKSTFSIPKEDTNVEVYNGQGKKLGFRPLINNNEFGVPIIKDFYIAIARLVEGATLDGISLTLFRGYQSFENQIETRRRYAPSDKKSNEQWLITANADAGFKNFEGDRISVNPPGHGYHILGNTFDIDTIDSSSYDWMIENAHNYGFYRTIENEIWHWEYKPWLYRLGGIENPGVQPLNSIGGWVNEQWEKLYVMKSNDLDPIGPKFLPKKHPSWLGKENLAKTKSINNGIPDIIIEGTTGSTFADLASVTPETTSLGIPVNEDEQAAQQLKKIIESKGYQWFEKPYSLNMIGIRINDNSVDDRFKDVFYVIYNDNNGQRQIKRYSITTRPGRSVIKKGTNTGDGKGAAILAPNQYDVYKLGFHGSSREPTSPYLAFWQLRGKMKIYRDGDSNDVYDYKNPETGFFGINIHRSSINWSSKDSNISTNIGPWSEGCQVFEFKDEYDEFIEIAKKSAKKQGASISKINRAQRLAEKNPTKMREIRRNPDYQFGEFAYTLLEESDFE